ncbi:MAG: type III secretion system export apparatus subunit SctR [Deltaproteobacteria bacterium]|nr:type III secretion system export apparatus subunit SctR [Deltaproteobacteria bacterium]
MAEQTTPSRIRHRWRRLPRWLPWTLAGVALLVASAALAARGGGSISPSDLLGKDSVANRPLILMVALSAMALIPFVGMMVTSFVKIAVVLSIARQAIGTQQTPPTTVITGLSIILTVYVMMPVGQKIYRETDKYFQSQNTSFFDAKNVDLILETTRIAKEPLRDFLIKHSHKLDRQMFYNVAWRMREPTDRLNLQPDDFVVIVPAFVISELKEAFQIGFIIFVPFLVIDMVVANILMALGMMMLSPTVISLPFKLLLFVLVDGWYLITRGLVLGYL